LAELSDQVGADDVGDRFHAAAVGRDGARLVVMRPGLRRLGARGHELAVEFRQLLLIDGSGGALGRVGLGQQIMLAPESVERIL
jgi:hypothetical protein